MSWKVDGLDREGLVFAPATQRANGKAPVVIALHGHGGTMRGFAKNTHFQTAWPEAVVVYLQGLPIPSKVDPLVKPEYQKETLASVLAIDHATGASQACGPGCTLYPSSSGTPVRSITHDGGHEFPPFATAAIVAFFKNHQLTP